MASFVAGVKPRLKLQGGPTGRYFVNGAGTPVQLRADAAWALPVTLTREKAADYFAKRKAQKFNAALIEAINVSDGYVGSATGAPFANIYGDLPFTGGDIRTPNNAYFNHLDYVFITAAKYDIQVLAAAGYLGASGGTEGWYQFFLDAEAAHPGSVQAFGAYLAARYARHHNVIWVNGGDYRPPTLAIPNALAAGLAADTRHMLTTHWARDSAGTDGSPSWLTCNSEYTHDNNIWSRITSTYAATTSLPILHLESYYENSLSGQPTLTSQDVQREMWAAYLSGAAGHVYGNHNVWYFPSGWESHLADGGAASMTVLATFFDAIAWYKLAPALTNSLVTAGRGTVDTVTYVTAAKAADGTLGVVYIPGGGSVTVALSGFAGTVTGTYVDPATGTPSSAGSFAASGTQAFDPPGSSDTVLFLQA